MPSVSLAWFGPPAVITQIWSKTLMPLMVLRTTTRTMTGRSDGTVTCQKRRIALALSIFAAS